MKPGECPVCHAANPLGSRRCAKCGSPLAPAAGAARGA
ncbi:zinc-ribbon domain-containing protein [Gordonibacter urolithinfaciens]